MDQSLVEVEQNNIIYLLNEEKKIASVISHTTSCGIIIIPHHINHNDQEYIVTSISANGFNFKNERVSIQFASDSEVQTIESNAFIPSIDTDLSFCSSVESVEIPSSLTELQKGWCKNAEKLNNIKINSSNPKYSLFEGKLIVGKTSKENENFDVLVFCVRNAETITIPNFIETIEPYSFGYCQFLFEIKIQDESKLRTIEKNAFSYSNIKSITIPPSLIDLEEGWCKNALYLNEFKVSEKNPKYSNYENQFIIGKSSSDKENFDVLVFCSRNVEIAIIPDFIEIIGAYSFQGCNKLQQVLFLDDSKLKIIKNNAFDNSSINYINIPYNVTQIEQKAFFSCIELESVTIQENSKLQKIGKKAFASTVIKSFKIPKHVTVICGSAFSNCNNLLKVEFQEDSELQIIEKNAFFDSPISSISIPPHVTQICEGAFALCNLLKIEIPENSELQIIGKNAFINNSLNSIEEFFIPSNFFDIDPEIFKLKIKKFKVSENNPKYSIYKNKFIVGKSSLENDNYDILVFYLGIEKNETIQHFANFYEIFLSKLKNNEETDSKNIVKIPDFIEIIGPYSFYQCKGIQQIEIPNNSKLSIIDDFAFFESSIKTINIPKNLIRIGKNAFSKCNELEKVEIPIDSKLEIIEEDAFSCSHIETINIPPHIKIIRKNTFSNCMNLLRIEILKNCELQTIEDGAFNNSSIQEINIPQSLIELKEGWCRNTPNLVNIKVNENNPKYAVYQDYFIIGKSSLENEYHDVLVFCSRNIKAEITPDEEELLQLLGIFDESSLGKYLTLPSFIEIIEPYSFEKCRIYQVEILTDSKLRIIDKYAFFSSLINIISIPSHVIKICKGAFSHCTELNYVEIQENSELQIIEKEAFSNSSITSISIPPHVTQICESAFSNCKMLGKVDIPENSELKIIEINAFQYCSFESIFIPSHLLILRKNTFKKPLYYSGDLKHVKISENSELQKIEKNAFDQYQIEDINLPSKLIFLDKNWMKSTPNFTKIRISENNLKYLNYEDKFIIEKSTPEKDFYDVLKFCINDIKRVSIPHYIEIIGPHSFENLNHLKRIEIPMNSNLSIIDSFAFNNSSIEYISIPSSVTRICNNAFSKCNKLQKIEFSTNSQLKTIEYNAFEESLIESIIIPYTVKLIDEYAFYDCSKLQKVEFQDNSQLLVIGFKAFCGSQIVCFSIPPNVEHIGYFAFSDCEKLQIVEFNEKMKYDDINSIIFYNSKTVLIMIPYLDLF